MPTTVTRQHFTEIERDRFTREPGPDEADIDYAERRAAARALRAIPSEARSEQSRSNGRRGGRPVLMVLIDDLGRSVGYCEAVGSRAGEIVEYGSRLLARTTPDGYVEPQTFRVEGRATLRRTRPADREDIRYNSREWDVQ